MSVGFLGIGSSPDYGGILRDYQNYTPKGWWTDEDQAANNLTRSRLAETATESGRGARLLAKRRMDARGLGGSPASEATFARIEEGTAAGRQKAGEAAEGSKYNIKLGREQMDFQRASTIFGSRWQRALSQDYNTQQQQTAFWNSLTGLAGDAMVAFGGTAAATPTGAAGGGDANKVKTEGLDPALLAYIGSL